jgi:hypothetical protein
MSKLRPICLHWQSLVQPLEMYITDMNTKCGMFVQLVEGSTSLTSGTGLTGKSLTKGLFTYTK